MSDQKKYTAEDIRLYLEGKLSPTEMHAMEMASLDDPFLADAIEGMQQFGDNQKFFAESAQLKTSLNERVKKKRRGVFPVQMLWKVAAVLLVVVTGVALIIYMGEGNKKPGDELAKKEEFAPSLTEADSVVAKEDTIKQNFYKDTVVATFKRERPAGTFKKQEARHVPNAAAPENVELETLSDASIEAVPHVDDTVINRKNEQAAVARALEGRAAGVDVSPADSGLNEVVVIAYGITKRSKRYDSPLAKNKIERRVEPEGGWPQFETYLDLNRNINAYDTTRRGTEKLSFVIDQSGRPTLITIINSLSPSHDKEITRLITEGPDWTIKKGNKRKVILSVVF